MNEQVGPKALWRNLKNEAPDWAQIIPSLPRKISALIDETASRKCAMPMCIWSKYSNAKACGWV